MSSGWLRSVLGSALSLLAVCCGASSRTDRVFDGRVVQGSYIAPDAYAAYAEGVVREANGEWLAAEQAYRRALRSDGHSPQIWTRLGVLACRQSLAGALEHFDRALDAEEYAAAWTERARCLSSRQQPAAALESALHSVQLAPRDAEANLLIVHLYFQSSRREQARAWCFAWLLLEPELNGGSAELLRQAEQLRDPELTALVQAELARREQARNSDAPVAIAGPSPALLQALREADLERAREIAAGAHVSPLDLALLAARHARPALALSQAQLLLAANPHDSAALVVGLSAAALTEDEPGFRQLLRQSSSDTQLPVELAKLLEGLLRTRVGEDAAQSWHAAYLRSAAPWPAPGD